MKRDEAFWIDMYRSKNAFWIHDTNPKRPHAELTSKKHSDGFFNSRLVIPDENLLSKAASDLLGLLADQLDDFSAIQCVVGPQTGATKLAELISDHVPPFTGLECFHASPAKTEINGVKAMVFDEKEAALVDGKSVLLCEDVLTTGGSVELAEQAVLEVGGRVLPFILVLVNRSGFKEVNGKKIIALIDRHMSTWNTKEECPLCQQGSEAIPAKDPVNWARLNAEY